MQMYDPPHPGEILRELCLEPLGINVTQAAKSLGINRVTLHKKIKRYQLKPAGGKSGSR